MNVLPRHYNPLPGFGLRASRVGDLAPNACAATTLDSTRAQLTWQGAPLLASLAGRVVRLRFRMNGASLYAFWLSRTVYGQSPGARPGS